MYVLNYFYLLELFEKNIEYIFVIIAIMITYLLIKLFIVWIVKLGAIRLLSYLVSSLFICIILLLTKTFLYDVGDSYVKATLHSLSILGVIVFVMYLLTYIRNAYKKA